MDFCPIDFRAELNEEQYAAVSAPPGPALVLAGAGSGKTRTLTFRVAWLLLQQRVHPGEILLLTFTNKAAREMLHRVGDLTGLQAPPWGGTFHSVGGRLLRIHGHHLGLNSNYTILDADDADKLLTDVITEVDKPFLKNKENPKAKVLGDCISYARNTRRPVEDVMRERYPWQDSLPGKTAAFAAAYDKRKRAQQVCDYDDLLVLWLRLLEEVPEVAATLSRRFRHVLVDEYQDTNLIQSEIIDRIASHHNVMAVGDDAQCIYTWRGAEVDNILRFPDRHPGATVYKIVRNYRSTPEILDLANAVLARQPAGSGYEKKLVAARGNGLMPMVVPVVDGRAQAEFLVRRIEGLHSEGVFLRDIAILYRAHYQALEVQLEFTRSGIPFVITSGLKFFDQAHVRDFVAQLRMIANPGDRVAAERVLSLLPKIGPATVRKILAEAEHVMADARRLGAEDAGGLFAAAPRDSAPVRLAPALGSDAVIAKVPVDAREDFRQLTATLLELDDLLHAPRENEAEVSPSRVIQRALEGWYNDYIDKVYTNAAERREDLEGLIGFAQRFPTLSDFLAQIVLMNSETSEKGTELPDDCVRMSTVHQAKGLEYPVVFVIGCAEEQFPLRRAVESGDVEEERRLFYVAATRAMDQLYLCLPLLAAVRQGGSLRLEASRFISELPPNVYEKLNYRPNRW